VAERFTTEELQALHDRAMELAAEQEMDASLRTALQLLAEAAGTPVHIHPDVARATADTMGTPAMGRLNFRPLYADIVRTQPDLLD
jgi:hypothetical protein